MLLVFITTKLSQKKNWRHETFSINITTEIRDKKTLSISLTIKHWHGESSDCVFSACSDVVPVFHQQRGKNSLKNNKMKKNNNQYLSGWMVKSIENDNSHFLIFPPITVSSFHLFALKQKTKGESRDSGKKSLPTPSSIGPIKIIIFSKFVKSACLCWRVGGGRDAATKTFWLNANPPTTS